MYSNVKNRLFCEMHGTLPLWDTGGTHTLALHSQKYVGSGEKDQLPLSSYVIDRIHLMFHPCSKYTVQKVFQISAI